MAVSGLAVSARGAFGTLASSDPPSSSSNGGGREADWTSVAGALFHQLNQPADVSGRCGVVVLCDVGGSGCPFALLPFVFASLGTGPPWLELLGFDPLVLCSWSSAGLPPASLSGPLILFEGLGGVAPALVTVLCILLESLSFFESNWLRFDCRLDLTLPPKIFSRATEVDADALGGAGQDPYQLRAL